MRVNVYHALQTTLQAKVLAEGLHYGKQGGGSRQPFAARANAFLDEHYPRDLGAHNLMRQKCVYAFLELDGMVLDVTSGRPVAPTHWYPGAGKVPLRLSIDASIGYVADLNMYDHIAGLLAHGPTPGLSSLAYRYWRSMLPLGHVVEHYTVASRGIIAKPTAPIHLPRDLGRVEVLLTRSIPPSAITAL
ncbi:MAG TPA: hypothetical protein VLA88_00945 [Candidatus Saccharimonadales bacterium]|nr:hypothetical protein [Candidatus Saccharimonadales bacterium]